MARKRAVILEVDGRVARVLAAGGEFRTIRAPKGLRVGDEVDVEASAPAFSWRPQLALVATLVIILAFGGAGLNALANSFNEVAAFVTVDINPSVELGVNRWGWVISARGLNDDGVDLLSGTEHRALKLAEFVPELTRLATERGYIAAGKPNTVIVAAAPAAAKPTPDSVRRELALAKEQAATAVAEQQGPPVTVATIVAPDETLHADAAAMDISVGNLAVVLEARESGVPVRVSDVKQHGLAKAIETAGGKLSDLVVKAQDEGDYKHLVKQHVDQLKQEKKDDDDKGKGKDQGLGSNSGNGHQGNASPPGGGTDPNQGTGAGTGSGGSNDTGSGASGGTGNGGTPICSGTGGGQTGSDQGSGGGSGQGKDNDKDKDKDNGKGKDKGKGEDRERDWDRDRDGDNLTDRIRDGLRELGERIKHQMGKGKGKDK